MLTKACPQLIVLTLTVLFVWVSCLVRQTEIASYGQNFLTTLQRTENETTPFNRTNNDPALHRSNGSVTSAGNKIILLWNSFFGERDFGLGALGRLPFMRNRCKTDTCTVETDRNLLNRSSAVVFHVREKLDPFPAHANSRQLFAYFLRESPYYTLDNSKRYRQHFNVTMTYRSDSDIPVPLVRFVRQNKTVSRNYTLRYPLSSRKGSVVWLASHCKTASKREVYVAALARYIKVDIYGACGSHHCRDTIRCMKHFESRYKFYLGFENSYCREYVTEKYYRTFNFELIPIVYGDANYSKLGPPDVFINILDYGSPKELADYLHYLSRNETAYSMYFQSKQFWREVPMVGKGFCDLCQMVHNTSYHRVYSDVHQWWTKDSCDMETVRKLIASTE